MFISLASTPHTTPISTTVHAANANAPPSLSPIMTVHDCRDPRVEIERGFEYKETTAWQLGNYGFPKGFSFSF